MNQITPVNLCLSCVPCPTGYTGYTGCPASCTGAAGGCIPIVQPGYWTPLRIAGLVLLIAGLLGLVISGIILLNTKDTIEGGSRSKTASIIAIVISLVIAIAGLVLLLNLV